MRRLILAAAALSALTAALSALTAGHAMAETRHAISPAPPGTPPIGPDTGITPADLERINAQIRNDEDRLTQYRDAALDRGSAVIVNTRPALSFEAYPHPRSVNFGRLLGWRKPRQ